MAELGLCRQVLQRQLQGRWYGQTHLPVQFEALVEIFSGRGVVSLTLGCYPQVAQGGCLAQGAAYLPI